MQSTVGCYIAGWVSIAEIEWSFPISLSMRRDPLDSAPYSECRTPFPVFRTDPARKPFLLKTSRFCVASLTCGPVRALCGPGYSVLWGLKSKCARCFTFSKPHLLRFHQLPQIGAKFWGNSRKMQGLKFAISDFRSPQAGAPGLERVPDRFCAVSRYASQRWLWRLAHILRLRPLARDSPSSEPRRFGALTRAL